MLYILPFSSFNASFLFVSRVKSTPAHSRENSENIKPSVISKKINNICLEEKKAYESLISLKEKVKFKSSTNTLVYQINSMAVNTNNYLNEIFGIINKKTKNTIILVLCISSLIYITFDFIKIQINYLF